MASRSARFSVCLFLLAAGSVAPVMGQCRPEWMPGPFGVLPSYGANARATALGLYSPPSGAARLVIGGGFTNVAGGDFSHIATWTGTEWIGLGSGLSIPGFPTAAAANAVAMFNGDLVATGGYTTAGSTSALNIAHWNGNTWAAMGNINNVGQALLVHNGVLYLAGGLFTQTGMPTGLLRWNGSNWEDFGGGVNGQVWALESYHGDLILGGTFTQAGSSPVSNIARWNGQGFVGMGGGVDAPVLALKANAAGDSLYAGGAFGVAGGLITGGLALWNGVAWHDVGGASFSGLVRALENYDGKLVIGGKFPGQDNAPNIIQFDGVSFSNLGSGGAPGEVHRLQVFDGSLIVGGEFTSAGGIPAQNLARWSGREWSELRPAPDAPVRALLSNGSGLYAGGDFEWNLNGLITAHHLVSTNGSAVGEVAASTTSPNGVNGPVRAMAFHQFSIVQPPALIVGGEFTQAGGANAANIARFTGTAWQAMGTGMDAPVNAVIQFGTRVIATGSFQLAGGVGCAHIAQWNGSWNPMGAGLAGLQGNALAAYSGELYVGGDFASAGGIAASDIARWNGTAWNALDSTAFSGQINALTVFNSQLIAAGDFDGNLPGAAALHLAAAWNGSAWTPMHAGLPEQAFIATALAVHQGDVYLGGRHTFGSRGITVFRWTGQEWVPASDATDRGVLALASAAGDLWAGGTFTVASGRATPHLARLRCPCPANCDNSTVPPVLNVLDFACFLNAFASGLPYANCDGSTTQPTLNVLDFSCYLNKFAAGCP